MSTDQRVALRPSIPTSPAQQPAEAFLHHTLRPVLKLQNELLIALTEHFLVKRKIKFNQLSTEQQRQQIQHSIGRDNRLRGLLFGCIIGQFTVEEMDFYLANEGEVNRRITSLLVERLWDQMGK